MNPFKVLWAELLYRPVFNLLIIFLAIFGWNLGIAIVLLTLLVRMLLLRNSMAGANMSKGMTSIQPKMLELQEKYQDNPQKLSEETMKLLKKEGAGPLKGCLSLLIQMPVFIGLYFVIRKFAIGEVPSDWLYSFFFSFGNQYLDPNNVNAVFLGMDLFAKNSVVLTAIVAVLNFLQFQLTSLIQPKSQPAAIPWSPVMPDMSKMMGPMNIIMTIMMASIVRSFPSWIGLYLATTSLFSIVQYIFQYRVALKAKWNAFFHKNKPIVIEKK